MVSSKASRASVCEAVEPEEEARGSTKMGLVSLWQLVWHVSLAFFLFGRWPATKKARSLSGLREFLNSGCHP